jgi:hypothetical protein
MVFCYNSAFYENIQKGWLLTLDGDLDRLLKNAHLRRSPHPSSLQRTFKYASLLRISGALHLGIFDQPGKSEFFNRILMIIPLLNVLMLYFLAFSNWPSLNRNQTNL